MLRLTYHHICNITETLNEDAGELKETIWSIGRRAAQRGKDLWDSAWNKYAGAWDLFDSQRSLPELPRTLESFERAKRLLYANVHRNHRVTLYCGCHYDLDGRVDWTFENRVD